MRLWRDHPMQHLWPFLTHLGRHELPILLSPFACIWSSPAPVCNCNSRLHYCVCSTLEAIIPLDFGVCFPMPCT